MLVSSQTAVKGGYGFQTGGTGARYKITSILFEVCIRDQACFRLCLYVFPLQVHKSSRKVSRFGRRIDAWKSGWNWSKPRKEFKDWKKYRRVNPTVNAIEKKKRRCGYGKTHKKCPAMGQQCALCKKMNHYVKSCRSKEFHYLEDIGLSPAQLLMGRRLKNELPMMESLLTPTSNNQNEISKTNASTN